MRGTLNAHRLFIGGKGRPGYLDNLKVSDQKEQALRRARDLVRQALRDGMPLQRQRLAQDGFIDRAMLAEGREIPLKPKFRMQGSAVYRTLNDPAHTPPQEIDYDDGVFLPTSFLARTNRPALAAKGYFKAVESALEALCKQEGWELDTSKDCCVRIRGVAIDAHIDIPLYAIPDDDFSQLTEAAQEEIRKSIAADGVLDEASFAEPVFKQLRADHIMLATRNAGWRESDPRKIEDWFLEAIRDHGEGLRHVCRYLKGWRDHTWPKSRLSSLALMTCAVNIYEEFRGAPPKNRDDLALLLVVEQLPQLLRKRIENPVLDDQYLDDGWSEEERRQFVTGAEHLYAKLNTALQQNYDKARTLQHLIDVFGPRMPRDEDLLELENEEARVQTYEPRRVAAPAVARTISG